MQVSGFIYHVRPSVKFCIAKFRIANDWRGVEGVSQITISKWMALLTGSASATYTKMQLVYKSS